MLRGIRTRLLGLVIATVVPFTALIGGGLWNQWRGDQTQAIRSALIEARLLAAQVDDQISDFNNLLVGLGQAVSPNPEDIAANDAVLRRAKAELPDYIGNILLSSLDGKNIGTSFEPAEGGRTYLGDRDFFGWILAGRQGVAVGDPVRGRTTGNWVTTVARRVKDSDGRLTAVIGVGIQIEHFQKALRVHDLPAGSVVQIINDAGTVILRSVDGSGWVGRELPGERNRRPPRGLDRSPRGRALARPCRTHHRVGYPGRSPLARLGRLADATRLGQGGLAAGLGAAASLITLLVALGLASAFSGRIISPLRQLSEDASALAAGKLTHRTAVNTQDEVGALANTFNAMAASLEARHRDIDLAREAASAEAIERARLEQMERQAKETLAAVIDASPVAIVCSNLERDIVLWSRAAEQVFGYTAQETIGQRTKLIPPDAAAESQALFERCVQGEAVRDREVRRKRKDGSIVDIRLAATPMYSPDGTVWCVAWAYDDITGRKKAERQLNQIAHYDQLTGLPNRVSLKNELTTCSPPASVTSRIPSRCSIWTASRT